jgi:DNA-binding LacI/PurR family transcriptional regulator
MGEIAAQTLLGRIEDRVKYVPEIAIEPELVVRRSTARPRKMTRPSLTDE